MDDELGLEKEHSFSFRTNLLLIFYKSCNLKNNRLHHFLTVKLMTTKNSDVFLHPNMIKELKQPQSDDNRPIMLSFAELAYILHILLNISLTLDSRDEVMEIRLNLLSEVVFTKKMVPRLLA